MYIYIYIYIYIAHKLALACVYVTLSFYEMDAAPGLLRQSRQRIALWMKPKDKRISYEEREHLYIYIYIDVYMYVYAYISAYVNI